MESEIGGGYAVDLRREGKVFRDHNGLAALSMIAW